MESNLNNRVWVFVLALIVAAGFLIYRIADFQLLQNEELGSQGEAFLTRTDIRQPERGDILDREGYILAGPGYDYEVGVNVPWVYDADELALDMATILGTPYSELVGQLNAAVTEESQYVHLENRVSADIANSLRNLEEDNGSPYRVVQLNPVPRRQYPEGQLMCHTLGFVDFAGIGSSGLEARYQAELAGKADGRQLTNNPGAPREMLDVEDGMDIVLTIDRTIQYTVESHLYDAMQQYQAESGSIIVLEPDTGAILAMASLPCFSPYNYFEESESLLINPAVSEQYEPGSVMKLITMASGLDDGSIVPSTIFADSGVIYRGGIPIRNAEESIYGSVDMTSALVFSLNTAMAWIADQVGVTDYYSYLERFGFGRPTGVDLSAETSGTILRPSSATWTEASLATSAFGQGIAVTPLQMVSAVASIANGGNLMKPYLVDELWQNGELIQTREPQPQSNPVSPEAARIVRAMAREVAQYYEIEVPGYTVAGKTGTAQIPLGGTYHPTDVIASFVGWLPADNPEFVMLVKLDKPQAAEWGSESAAPAWAKLAQELVVLMNIPPDPSQVSAIEASSP